MYLNYSGSNQNSQLQVSYQDKHDEIALKYFGENHHNLSSVTKKFESCAPRISKLNKAQLAEFAKSGISPEYATLNFGNITKKYAAALLGVDSEKLEATLEFLLNKNSDEYSPPLTAVVEIENTYRERRSNNSSLSVKKTSAVKSKLEKLEGGAR